MVGLNRDNCEVVLRTAREADMEFIWQLRVATMKDMIAATYGWDDETQRRYARESLRGRIAIADGEPAGVLTVADWTTELHLVWVAVVPRLHGRGLGHHLVRQAMDEAIARRMPLSLQVLRNNPAMSLYSRLGFVPVAENGPHKILMRWNPAMAPP